MAETPTRPSAALFDMDGLLLDTERLALAVFLELGQGRLSDDMAELEAFFRGLVGSSSALTRARLAETFPHVDTVALDAEWRQAYQSKVAAGIPLRPRVREALEALDEKGVRMAVVTSTHGDPARHHLEIAGLSGFFERVTGGDEVSATKPDPAPYRETAAAMGLDPAVCAAFEDSDRGTEAAVRAGCRVVQVPDLRPEGVPLPDLGQAVAQDLWEALARVGLR